RCGSTATRRRQARVGDCRGRGAGLRKTLPRSGESRCVHGGREVARTSAVREYCDSAASSSGRGLPRQGRGPA
ncbi:hypothetical protein ACFWHF_34665, partial [Streptomyces griseoincarnatus]